MPRIINWGISMAEDETVAAMEAALRDLWARIDALPQGDPHREELTRTAWKLDDLILGLKNDLRC
jgi:hypothetical protein